jgi:nucleoside-diphosphate-sugar epimerase
VAALWRAAEHEVFVTTRSAQRAEDFRREGLSPVVSNVLDAVSMRALPRVDTAVYCVSRDRESADPMRAIHVDGLRNVLDALPDVETFIQVSSTSVYGQTQGELVDETAPTEPIEESGQVVLEAEEILSARRPDAIRLRFAGIYGPGRVIRQQAVASGEPLVGNGLHWLNLIHVDDGAQVVVACDQLGPIGEAINVVDNEPVQRASFYSLMADLLHAPPPRFVAPAPGAPQVAHGLANRRVSNRRMHERLGVQLAYPSYRSGLPAILQGREPLSERSLRP